jgi:hypothetical protein
LKCQPIRRYFAEKQNQAENGQGWPAGSQQPELPDTSTARKLKVRSDVPIINGNEPSQVFFNRNAGVVERLNAASIAVTCFEALK